MPAHGRKKRPEIKTDGKSHARTARGSSTPCHAPATRSEADLPWRTWEPLFPPLSTFVKKALEQFPEILAEVWPLKHAHRKSLPDDIRELSRMLTSQRERLRQPYWSQPRFISAYLYYFLPWNLLRLCRLLPALPIPAPAMDEGRPPLLVDAGAGPLTLTLALWLSKKDWRDLPLHALAMDTSRQPLECGIKLFTALGQKLDLPTWEASVSTGSIASLPRLLSTYKPRFQTFLIAAANVLNEIGSRVRGTRRYEHGGEADDDYKDDALVHMFEAFLPMLGSGTSFLFIEPGTRLGGTFIMRLRQFFLEYSSGVLAPCTHSAPCPLLEGAASRRSSLSSAWCHFVFGTEGAPQWLLELSRQAGLAKNVLTLSPLLFHGAARQGSGDKNAVFPARVISAPFAIPEAPGNARYACCAAGKRIMAGAENVPCGALVEAMADKTRPKDKKSGVPFIRPPQK